MIEFLRTWITNIAVIIIFVMLMDIILPNNSMKRFINVIVGLLIILVVVKPFVMLGDGGQLFNFKVIETANIIDSNYITEKSSELNKKQKLDALKLYENNLKTQIKSLLSKENSVKADNIEIDIRLVDDPDSEDFGKVEELSVGISDNSVKTVAVSKISVGSTSGEENNKTVINGDNAEYKLSNDRLAGEVKFTLSKTLGLDEKCIFVTVQE